METRISYKEYEDAKRRAKCEVEKNPRKWLYMGSIRVPVRRFEFELEPTEEVREVCMEIIRFRIEPLYSGGGLVGIRLEWMED